MRIKPVIAFYLLCSAAFLLLSGRPEGFVTPRAILFLAAAIAVGHMLVTAISLLRRVRTQDKVSVKSSALTLAAASAFIIAIPVGLEIDRYAENAAKVRGNDIIERAQEFYKAEGSCPSAIRDMYDPGSEIPRAMGGSRYHLDRCRVWFASTAFTTCERHILDADWTCID